MNPNHYFIQCDNQYSFQACCHEESKRALDYAFKQAKYPNRFTLLMFGVSDAIYGVFYLIKKITEIACFTWNLYLVKDSKENCFHRRELASNAGVITLHLGLPIICTAIRVASSAVGIISAKYALMGWIIAESGEELAYHFWSGCQRGQPNSAALQEVSREINPRNAIFYLGEPLVIESYRQANPLDINIEAQIHENFKTLLTHLQASDKNKKEDEKLFNKLLKYEEAIKYPKLVNRNPPPYLLSFDTQQILLKLRDNNIKNELIETIFEVLTMAEIHRLFIHIQLNLRGVLQTEQLKLQQVNLDAIEELTDLFSRNLKFGRARFHQNLAHL